MSKIRMLLTLFIVCALPGCTYIESVSKQFQLSKDQQASPSQHTARLLIDNDNYFVYGQLLSDDSATGNHTLVVAAVSDDFQANEIVDENHIGKIGSYYALHLPAGDHQILVLEDKNDDGRYTQTELIGRTELTLSPQNFQSKVVGNIDIRLTPQTAQFEHKLDIPVQVIEVPEPSSVFPKGSIRSLNDPIFSDRVAKLGLYDPPTFLEIAPMMFYALEEDAGYKVPVIFVHGIGGSPKEFNTIISHLDRDKYKPWFYYYPSGSDLSKLAELFYNIYLSGTVAGRGNSDVIIVAHSMGGLVVREALNLYQGNGQENPIKLFISIASPFGGISSAQSGVDHAPLVIPAWRGLTPTSEFITHLFRNSLPSTLEHHLMYAYQHSGAENDNDGVVPVHSQLPSVPNGTFSGRYGFNAGHTEVLSNPNAIDTLIQLISHVKSPFPDSHLAYITKGGFNVELNDSYSELEKFIIQESGFYLRAIANGDIDPIPLNSDFVNVVQGRAAPHNHADTAWLKFRVDYPEIASGQKDE